MPLSVRKSQFIWRESYTNKSEGGVLVHIMGHFTDYFGMRDLGGKCPAYSNLGRLHRGHRICSKYNTCAHLIIVILNILIYINSSHILTFSNFLLAIRGRCNYGHSIDSNQRNFHKIKPLANDQIRMNV